MDLKKRAVMSATTFDMSDIEGEFNSMFNSIIKYLENREGYPTLLPNKFECELLKDYISKGGDSRPIPYIMNTMNIEVTRQKELSGFAMGVSNAIIEEDFYNQKTYQSIFYDNSVDPIVKNRLIQPSEDELLAINMLFAENNMTKTVLKTSAVALNREAEMFRRWLIDNIMNIEFPKGMSKYQNIISNMI